MILMCTQVGESSYWMTKMTAKDNIMSSSLFSFLILLKKKLESFVQYYKKLYQI